PQIAQAAAVRSGCLPVGPVEGPHGQGVARFAAVPGAQAMDRLPERPGARSLDVVVLLVAVNRQPAQSGRDSGAGSGGRGGGSGRRGLISTSSLGTATRCPRISTTVRVAPVLTTGYHAPCRSIGSLTKGGAATHTRAQPTGWIIVSTGWIIVIGMAPRWPAVL